MFQANQHRVLTKFADDSLLVIDKPPGLVVTPAETHREQTLSEILQKDYGISLERGGVVHRLDKDTSGLILVAKTKEALENLQAQFMERKTKKEYLALVHGLVEKSGVVDASIARNPVKREKFSVLDVGKKAITEYEPRELRVMSEELMKKIFSGFNKIQFRKLLTLNYKFFTLVACRPLTGRTHQIRVHLKYIGHPIVSDEKYVGRKMYRLDKRWCPRQFLHAKRIGFYHPVSGSWMEVESELPEDLKKALSYLSSRT